MTNTDPSNKKQTHEMLYLGAFVLGMAFVWISGHAGLSIAASHPGLNYIVNFLISGAIYGLGVALVVYFAAGRNVLISLLLGLVAAILGPLLTYVLGNLVRGHINNKNDFGLFTFGLYLIFGAVYPVLLGLGRRLNRRHFDAPGDTVHNK